MNDNFYKNIYDIKSDIELFDVIANTFASFRDERIYNDEKVYFYKLAQLLTSDILHLRESLENINVDYSNLIGYVDYKIPQTLRTLEIIEYSNELFDIIDNNQEIEVGSE